MIPAQFQQMETGNLEMNFGPRKGYGLHRSGMGKFGFWHHRFQSP